MSKESFKIFAKQHPELTEYIKNGSMTWQKFYEIYDIYGEEQEAWNPYIANKKPSVSNFQDIIGNIDTKSIQKHVNTAQKAIGVIQELIGKSKSSSLSNTITNNLTERPINKFFED